MPPKPEPRVDALRDLGSALDPETRLLLNDVVREALLSVKRRLRIGDPNDLKLILGALVPGLLRSANAGAADDGGLRAEFDEVMRAVRGESPVS